MAGQLVLLGASFLAKGHHFDIRDFLEHLISLGAILLILGPFWSILLGQGPSFYFSVHICMY
jgi:hypothetical protein